MSGRSTALHKDIFPVLLLVHPLVLQIPFTSAGKAPRLPLCCKGQGSSSPGAVNHSREGLCLHRLQSATLQARPGRLIPQRQSPQQLRTWVTRVLGHLICNRSVMSSRIWR